MTPPEDVRPTKKFLIWEMIGRGWNIMWEHKWQILGIEVILLLLYIVLAFCIDFLFSSEETAPWFSKAINFILGGILNFTFSIGIINLALRYADLLPVKFRDFFTKMPQFISYFFSTVLMGICTFLGFLCLVIPGFIVLARLCLYPYFIVDKGFGPERALEESWATVKGATWHMLGFMGASILVNLAGLLCLGIGFAFTFPATAIANALVYRNLWTQTKVVLLADKEPAPPV